MSETDLLQHPATQAIAWALLQFIWQGALIGAFAAIALVVLRRAAADVRYVVATLGLAAMTVTPIVTSVQTWTALGTDARAGVSRAGDRAAVEGTLPVESVLPSVIDARTASGNALALPPAASSIESKWLGLALVAWSGGVLILSLRLLAGWIWIRRLQFHGTSSVPEQWERVVRRLSRRLRIGRSIRILQSAFVRVPTVAGWIRPMLLIPTGALTGMAPHQLEAILAHELAHIRRHDYLVNLLQTFVETLLFYHPAVWWLSRRIRVERENCCDDLAVSLCGDPYSYARALADLEELRAASDLAMAANGGALLNRVRRLLADSSHAGRAPGWLAGSAAVVLIAAIAAMAAGRNVLEARQESGSTVITIEAEPSTVMSGQQAPDHSFIGAVISAVIAELRSQFLMWEVQPVPPAPPTPPTPPAPVVSLATPPPPPLRAMPVSPVLEQPALPPAPPAPPVPPGLPAAPAAMPPALPAPPAPPVVAPALPPQPPVPPVALQAVPAVPPVPPPPPEGANQGNFRWSDGKSRLEVRYEGDVEFTDDDSDVSRLSPGGMLRISEANGQGDRRVEFRADGSGNITRRFWRDSNERPFEPEGRSWMVQVLPRFIRQSGIGAGRRVERILKSKGPAGVLAEISLIEGSFAKRRYFTELVNRGKLDAAAARQVLVQAGREIESDFELASLLIDSADRLLLDNSTRAAYFEAAASIGSDFEARRVYSAALARPMSPELLALVLQASSEIGSDFEQAALLMQIVSLGPIEGPIRAPLFRAIDGVGSAFERGRVLQAIAKRSDLSQDSVLAVLAAAQTVGSNFETGNVLRTIAAHHKISGAARDAYIKAAEKLGDFEEGRALAALVRSEQR